MPTIFVVLRPPSRSRGRRDDQNTLVELGQNFGWIFLVENRVWVEIPESQSNLYERPPLIKTG